jgi:hypothetical protein
LGDDEIGADLWEAADILEPVLFRLRLGAMPRAHQFTVADLTVRVRFVASRAGRPGADRATCSDEG